MTPERQLECFIKLLKHESEYSKIGFIEHVDPALIGFAISTLRIADRYRFDEPYSDIFQLAAKDLISRHITELTLEFAKDPFNVHTFHLNGKFVPELCSYAKSHWKFKSLIEILLEVKRDEMFDSRLYSWQKNGMNCKEHPMVTFAKIIDVIESLKGTEHYKTVWNIKREVWQCLRVGYSVFDKSDWKPRMHINQTLNLFNS